MYHRIGDGTAFRGGVRVRMRMRPTTGTGLGLIRFGMGLVSLSSAKPRLLGLFCIGTKNFYTGGVAEALIGEGWF